MSKPEHPLNAFVEMKHFKLYLFDVALFIYKARLREMSWHKTTKSNNYHIFDYYTSYIIITHVICAYRRKDRKVI